MNELTDKLITKSKEAFVLSIEIYNKPTIQYRIEGFSFLVCNAWELMLKAYLIKRFGNDSIYHKDNPSRTISLEKCVAKIFTNDKAPMRLNLEKIIELRNTSTHFITEEYEMVYVPLFQSCILNFNEKMKEFHDVDMTEVIPQNFLSLSVSMKSLDESEILAKYPDEIASKLIISQKEIAEMVEGNNSDFAIRIEHHHFITKNKNLATSFVAIDNTSDNSIKIVKELKNPNDTHKYNMKKCLKEINKRLKRLGIVINEGRGFTSYDFQIFVRYYGLKENEKFCYVHNVYAQPQYSYSMKAIDFIVEEIKKDSEKILQNLKQQLSKKDQ